MTLTNTQGCVTNFHTVSLRSRSQFTHSEKGISMVITFHELLISITQGCFFVWAITFHE